MALRDLVEGECGGPNSLVRLTSHFVQDRGLRDEGFRRPVPHADAFASSSADADQLVQQFLEETLGQTTPTFRMDSLLEEMRELERGIGAQGPAPVQSPPIAQLAAQEDVSCWADQYLEAGKHFQERSDRTSIWSPEEEKPQSSDETFELGFGPNWAKEYLESSENLQLDEPDQCNLADFASAEDYSEEQRKETDPNALRDTANQLATTMSNEKFMYSKFLKFMHQIGDGEVTIQSGEVLKGDTEESEIGHSDADKWASEYASSNVLEESTEDEKDADAWASQYMVKEDHSEQQVAEEDKEEKPDLSEEAFTRDLWNKLADQWREMINEGELDVNPWVSQFNNFASFKEYKFAAENPMKELDDALEEGKKRLAEGDLPSAILCFEAAAQNQPDNPLVWQLLGTTQAENEQDPQAISALKKCLQLEPSNLTARMALAVSYTNENYQHQACLALRDWIRENPKYSDLVDADDKSSAGHLTSLLPMDLHRKVCSMYIAAARRNPQDSIDPDVQCGLGVLFNLVNEQDKAADCFRAALQVRPDDSRLWNRLGATLANGNRSEEAVDAYHIALQLTPGFIRARYNLGITCTHLGAHREAAEHLLMALNQQAAGRGLQGEKSITMSDTIWSTLRLVITLMERPDLVPAVNDRDLNVLNKEFGINE